MSNKVKVPGGAFYAGDGLTVDPVTRTVSAGGGDGGSTGGGLFKVTITGTANESGDGYTYVSDKTGKEVYDALMNGMLPYAELIVDGGIYFTFVPCMYADAQDGAQFIGATSCQSINNEGKILVSSFDFQANIHAVTYSAFILSGLAESDCGPYGTLFN